MKSLKYLVLFLTLASTLYSQEIKKPPEPLGPEVIVFPKKLKTVEVQPEVQTVEVEDEAPIFKPGELYIVAGDIDFILLASPSDKLNIVYATGPSYAYGVFFDGSGKHEGRQIPNKFIAYVSVTEGKTGIVELLGIPKGVQEEKEIQRVKLNLSPQPPPDPPVPPEPPVPPQPKGFRVVFIYDAEKTPIPQLNVLLDPDVADYLDRKVVKDSKGKPEWRRWDKDIGITSDESKDLKGLYEAVKDKVETYPSVAIAVDGVGKYYPLPATKEDLLKLLKSHGGD